MEKGNSVKIFAIVVVLMFIGYGLYVGFNVLLGIISFSGYCDGEPTSGVRLSIRFNGEYSGSDVEFNSYYNISLPNIGPLNASYLSSSPDFEINELIVNSTSYFSIISNQSLSIYYKVTFSNLTTAIEDFNQYFAIVSSSLPVSFSLYVYENAEPCSCYPEYEYSFSHGDVGENYSINRLDGYIGTICVD